MPTNATDRTLGLINIWQVLRKLLWEVELLAAIPVKIRIEAKPADVLHVEDARIYAAINAFSTSLALVDWLYHCVKELPLLGERCMEVLPNCDLSSSEEFSKSLRKISRPLNASHQVCNSNKHFFLRKPQSGFHTMIANIVSTDISGAVEVSVVMHITHDDRGSLEEYSADEILRGLVAWWQSTLEAINVPGRDEFFPDAKTSCAR
ncbi:hypothetical protein JHC42_16230 [Pseudomonas sp. OA3]|jgi:hypothetical protein|nr:hypothetical protein [Pseudomonas sp. OA3]